MDEALAGDHALKKAFRTEVHNSIKGREFYIASPKNYRGVDGIYEYGPIGRAIESKVLGFWHEHFALEEGMSVVSRPYSPPKILLKGSEHLDKCTVPVMMDDETRNCYRADHVLNGVFK
ncbi:glycine--tRNA ligase, mitochondrial 1-like [Syzygium oleosum]|uniref:glycine--tRNA ligase, mitochondrial 1-like n=1 Tax=Syzygium oleosum TaxID=219896 RepID=UPI0024BA5D08|nr:glycine--tRNA ligase, mitochondrial 1-like [Syzygium oleosum]